MLAIIKSTNQKVNITIEQWAAAKPDTYIICTKSTPLFTTADAEKLNTTK